MPAMPLPFRLTDRWCVTEEVEINRPRRAPAYRFERRPDLTATQLSAGQRTQPAGSADCDRKCSGPGSSHRRQNDWQLNTKQVEDPLIGPRFHRAFPFLDKLTDVHRDLDCGGI